jgi:hypothetical protein
MGHSAKAFTTNGTKEGGNRHWGCWGEGTLVGDLLKLKLGREPLVVGRCFASWLRGDDQFR